MKLDHAVSVAPSRDTVGRIAISAGILIGAVAGPGLAASAFQNHTESSSQWGCNFSGYHDYGSISVYGRTNASSLSCALFARVKIFYGDTSVTTSTTSSWTVEDTVLTGDYKKTQHYARAEESNPYGLLVGFEMT